ncbi:MAG: lipid-A-disaccharide synthase [Betaproteobacteria bacterium]|jgi:lipid-A-disaccharide synthase|nr:lipid-A-disaccharide synthase [Betaproteobacteria bacterium]MEA3152776.1 lipid-A-disaccharide synthase [Betaproteobacteria bacterium]
MPKSTDRAYVIGIVAGEASGDQLGAHLMRSLLARNPRLHFVGIGGPKMEAAGAEILFPMEKLAVRGYVEVIRHYWEIVGIRRRLRRYFLRNPPALFIGVDAPDFNLDLEIDLRKAGIPTVQYVAPAVWAWRRERIQKVKQAVSALLTLFPFETRLYEGAGVPVCYVGHPLADLLADLPPPELVREELRVPIGVPVVAMLPGSRVSELENMAELFVRTAVKLNEQIENIRFLVPFASRDTKALFEAALYRVEPENLNLTMVIGHSLEAMAAADVVLVASGTASLEAALLKRPMVITYKMNRLSWWMLRKRAYLSFVGMPNILAGESVVPELLQDAATPETLAEAVKTLLYDKDARARLDTHFESMRHDLRQNTAEKAAAALMPLLSRVPV